MYHSDTSDDSKMQADQNGSGQLQYITLGNNNSTPTGDGKNNSGPKTWTPNDMEAALEALRSHNMSLTKASATYGIPSTTLWQRAHRLGIGEFRDKLNLSNYSSVVLQKSSYEIIRHAQERRPHEDLERGFSQQRPRRPPHRHDLGEQSFQGLRHSLVHSLQDRPARGNQTRRALQRSSDHLVR